MKDRIMMIVNGVPEGVQIRNVAGAIFKETLANNFSKLTKDIKSQNQEAL